MLSTVNVANGFVLRVLVIVDELSHLHILVTLKARNVSFFSPVPGDPALDSPIKKNTAKSLLKVLPETSNNFLEDVHTSRPCWAILAFSVEIILKDLLDWFVMRKRNELVILGDILPVVNEHRLDVIRDRQVDHGLAVERLLLGMVSVLLILLLLMTRLWPNGIVEERVLDGGATMPCRCFEFDTQNACKLG